MEMNLFRAPAAARAAKVLDRALFSRTLPTAAASVRDNRLISKYRKQLEKTKEMLLVERLPPVVADPDPVLASQGRKCLILKPNVMATVPETWSQELAEATKIGDVKVVPYEVTIGYELWSYIDVARSILPEDLHGEIPVGFNTAGHVAHLNLRSQYLPYKEVIAQLIIDKNPSIRTVINKTDNVGTENEFRTFGYELLAGPDDLVVEVLESGCIFRFDYSKVYWNSKLGFEHGRLTELFKAGEVVVDVMAGIGPFAVPAGKKGVFVWANDKNPESFACLAQAIVRNKVSQFVRPFNEDGNSFIRKAADAVAEAANRGDCAVVESAKVSRRTPASKRPKAVRVPVPPTVAHFVMNLPASALEFLHNFRGLYHGKEELFEPFTKVQLPLVHAHCFAAKADDATPLNDICRRISDQIGVSMTAGDASRDGEVTIHEVRDVAPNKRMFCASFRLAAAVAFAPRG
ncbi:hypothetical protein CDD81_2259 [Ophiocordyceps australis]|uniref:tRNA (guanine(37)-N1)-methyltransferase n=1 Tax=Ophiocordyceps australis TaxID=1399860 RepID=A0A2C5XB22_9HYPO|nr:hypothetical protein CDD81_2259 [Ophiocordyceps australis]